MFNIYDVFSFEKGLIHQNHSLNPHNQPNKKSPKQNFSFPIPFIYLENPDPF